MLFVSSSEHRVGNTESEHRVGAIGGNTMGNGIGNTIGNTIGNIYIYIHIYIYIYTYVFLYVFAMLGNVDLNFNQFCIYRDIYMAMSILHPSS